MNRLMSTVSVVCLGAVVSLGAQQTKPATQAPAGKPTSVSLMASGPITLSVKAVYDEGKDYILRSAEMVTDKDFAFKPAGVAAEVRDYGQLLGHLANEQYAFCGAAMSGNEKAPADFEKTRSKVEMLKALGAAFAYCDKAYNTVNDHNGAEPVKLFGNDSTRIGALAYNNAHNFEHYGNLVTYLRAMGKVPPSSQPGK